VETDCIDEVCHRAILDCMMLPCDDVEAQVNCVQALRRLIPYFWRLHAESECGARTLVLERLPIARALLEANSSPSLIEETFGLFSVGREFATHETSPVFVCCGLIPVIAKHLEPTLDDGSRRRRPARGGRGGECSRQNADVVSAAAEVLAVLTHRMLSDARLEFLAHDVPAKLVAALSRHQVGECLRLESAVIDVVYNFLQGSHWHYDPAGRPSRDVARPLFDSGLVAAVAKLLPTDESRFERLAAVDVLREAGRVCSVEQMEALVLERDVLKHLMRHLEQGCHPQNSKSLEVVEDLFSRAEGEQRQRLIERFKALGGDAVVRGVATNSSRYDPPPGWVRCTLGTSAAKAFLTKFNL
jgi:hypothetical protein